MPNVVYDFERLLALDGTRNVKIASCAGTGLRDDLIVDVYYYDLPLEAIPQAIVWLQQNRAVVDGAQVFGADLPGPFRSIEVSQRTVDVGGRQIGTVVVQRFARHFYEAYAESALRIAGGKSAATNNLSAGVQETTSDNPLQTVIVSHPHVDRAKADSIAEYMRSKDWTNVVVDGRLLEGTWYPLYTSSAINDDGSATVNVLLARAKVCFKTYDGWMLPNGRNGYIINNVPLAIADDIVDGWKTVAGTGASATVSAIDDSTQTVTVILSVESERGVANSVTESSETCFDRVVAIEHGAQSEPGSLPEFERGKIVEIRNRKTPLGNWDVRIVERTMKAVQQSLIGKSETTYDVERVSGQRNVESVPLPEQTETGKIISVTGEKNPSCLYDVRVVETEAKKVEAARVSATSNTFVSEQSERHDNLKQNEISVEESGDGTIVATSVEKTRFPGMFVSGIERRTVKKVDDALSEVRESTYERVERSRSVGLKDSELEQVQSGDGIIASSAVVKSEFPDRFEQTVELRQAKPVESAETLQAVNRYVETQQVSNRNVSQQSFTPSAASGQIVEVAVSKSEYPGLLDERKTVRNAISVTDAIVDRAETEYTVEERKTHRSLAEGAVGPLQVPDGAAAGLRVEKSEFKDRVDVVETVETAKTVLDSEQSAVLNAFVHVRTEKDVGVTPSELEDLPEVPENLVKTDVGKIVEVRRAKSKFRNRYDQQVIEQTALTGETPVHNVTVNHGGVIVASRSAQHLDPENLPYWARDPTDPPEVGHGVSIRKSLNEFGGLTVRREDVFAQMVRRPDTGWYEVVRADGMAYFCEYDGVGAAQLQGIFDSCASEFEGAPVSIHPSVRFDESTGTYSVVIHVLPAGGGAGGNGAIQAFETSEQVELRPVYLDRSRADTDAPPVTWVRVEEWRWAVKQHPSLSTILGWLEEKRNAYSTIAKAWKTDIDQIYNWGYRGKYAVKISEGTWSKIDA